VLRESGWDLLDEKKGQKFITAVPPPAPQTQPTTQSLFLTPKSGDITSEVFVAPTTQPVAGDGEYQSVDLTPPLLVDASGTMYFDGVETLRVVTKDGAQTVWPLPAEAVGKGAPTLLRTPDGLLFLFNQPGRVLRIRPTPDEPEPFSIEATFTRRIPNITKPRRIWLDPAGRIVIAAADRLVLLFPQGVIPPAIRDMMPVDASGQE
jgi:hypothetical protein